MTRTGRFAAKTARLRRAALSDLPALFASWIAFPKTRFRRRLFSPRKDVLGLRVASVVRGPRLP